jgi:hypothetical protein
MQELFPKENTLALWINEKFTKFKTLTNVETFQRLYPPNRVSVLYLKLIIESLASDKHSNLLGLFISYKENEVL